MSNLSWVSWTLKKPQAVGVILSVVCACQVMPGPRLGSILGQRAISITQFCKEFNEKTKDVKEGFPLSTKIFINPDRTFEFKKGQPTIYYFLKAAAVMEKGAWQTEKEVAGLMSLKHTYAIDCVKAKDEVFAMQGVPLSSVVHSITGSARSLGIRVVKDLSAEALAAFQKERAMPLAAQKEADLAAQAEAAKK